MRYSIIILTLVMIARPVLAQSAGNSMIQQRDHTMLLPKVKPQQLPVQVLAQPKQVVTVFSMQDCPPCQAMEAEVVGNTEYEFKFVKDSLQYPDWLIESASKNNWSLPIVYWKSQSGEWFVSSWGGLEYFRKQCPPINLSQKTTVENAAAPTPTKEVERVLNLLPKPEIAFVDYGCGGDARWCIAAAERWGMPVIGVEIDPIRAMLAKERVQALGLSHLITIIEGNAVVTDVKADVGVAYLYEDVLRQLKPKIEKMKAFASYMHRPPDLPVTKNGDSWFYIKPIQAVQYQSKSAVWGNYYYSQPVCDNPGCAMCNSIRRQLGY